MFSGPLVRSVVPYVTIFASKMNLTKEIISTMIFFIKKYVEWEFHSFTDDHQSDNSKNTILEIRRFRSWQAPSFVGRKLTFCQSATSASVRPSRTARDRPSLYLTVHTMYTLPYIEFDWNDFVENENSEIPKNKYKKQFISQAYSLVNLNLFMQ